MLDNAQKWLVILLIWFRASDSEALARRLLEALNQKEVALEKAQAFRKRIAGRYSIQTIIPKLLAVYGKTY